MAELIFFKIIINKQVQNKVKILTIARLIIDS